MKRIDMELPHGCAVAVGALGEHALMPEEALCAARLRGKRRLQFTSGRHFARVAMKRLVGFSEPILRDDQRRPIWPAGLIGSISHSEQLAAAAVASGALRGVGIDVESANRVGSDQQRLHRKLFTDAECARNWADSRQGSVAFSAKEAAYKAINPLVGKYISLREVEVDIDWARSHFRVRYLGRHAPNRQLDGGFGRFCFLEGEAVTLFYIR